MTAQLAERSGAAMMDQVLDIAGPLGVGQDDVSKIQAVYNLTVEGLATLFAEKIDALTGYTTVPDYAKMSPLDLDRQPKIAKNGQLGEREDKRTLKVRADHKISQGITCIEGGRMSTYTYSGPHRRAVLEAPFFVEEEEDPLALKLVLFSSRNSRGNLATEPRHPSIGWIITERNLVTGQEAPPQQSGNMMQKGAKIMEETARFTAEKGIIFALGVEAVAKFSQTDLS